MPDSTPNIESLLEFCISRGGSDIHLMVGSPPVVRINTRLQNVNTKSLDPEDTVALMKSMTPERIQAEYMEKGSSDFGFDFNGHGRFRVSVFSERGLCALALRRIPELILTLEEIGLPGQVKVILQRSRGLFLVTGATGSGKTTTLASMLNHINENFGQHIIAIEDPIEYRYTRKKSIIAQREIGKDVPDFPEAIRRALRQDPDVILVGEMRDLETTQAALTAAETGHLVFATLHSSGSASTINRIIDQFPTNQQEQVRIQLAGNLVATLSQVLCPRSDGKGMVAAFEFMYVTTGIQNAIRTNKPFRIDSDIQTGGMKHGMKLLDDHLLELVKKSLITRETAVEKARNPAEMAEKFGSI